jgi:predicted PurR-regulated permease PerM
LRHGTSLAIVITVLTLALGVGIWLASPKLAGQVNEISKSLPRSMERVHEELAKYPWAQRAIRDIQQRGMGESPDLLGRITGFAHRSIEAFINIFIVVFLGIYFAAEPRESLEGVVSLVPRRDRGRFREVLIESGETLRLWMLGQVIPMVVIGVLTGLGLWIIGIPMAITLGVLAALFNFIPNFGPLISMVPATLMAISIDPMKGLWVVLLWMTAQTLEGYVLTPLVQKRMVLLPPALTIAMQVLLGVLAGGMGVALAAPLTAVGLVFVKMLYVEDTLHEEAELPSEAHEKG